MRYKVSPWLIRGRWPRRPKRERWERERESDEEDEEQKRERGEIEVETYVLIQSFGYFMFYSYYKGYRNRYYTPFWEE